jgi:hypothetical protein
MVSRQGGHFLLREVYVNYEGYIYKINFSEDLKPVSSTEKPLNMGLLPHPVDLQDLSPMVLYLAYEELIKKVE